ncbi:MAG: hypothetical protein QXU32_07270 [Nitrososphaerales archaeon]
MHILSFVIFSLLLSGIITNIVYAQPNRKIESITIPFDAANTEFSSREHYSFASKHIANWIVNIQNKLQYNEANQDAKVVLRLKENPEAENFVEIVMFSPPSYKLVISIANEHVGYMRMYEGEESWFTDRSVTASLVQNERLSINNGQRTVVDRLRIGEFTLGTLEVFGRESLDDEVNAIAGEIVVYVMSGNPLDNPILMVPWIVTAIAGGTVIALLFIKKRT